MNLIARLLIPLALLIAVSACTTLAGSSLKHKPDSDTLKLALSGALLLGEHWQTEHLPEQELFSLTPEMETFAETVVHTKQRRFERAQALQRALLLPVAEGGRGITYTAIRTGTPAEAFSERQVNCVSFTLLYVAMARHIGLPAYINEVDLPPSWDLRNRDAYLFLRHINAKVKLSRSDAVVIDLEMGRYHPTYEQRVISESLAAAQFYNNRGMELSAAGDAKQGFLYLRKALLLHDRQSYIWGNLGTLYQRQGMFDVAEAAYLYGLSLDAHDLTIMTNLSSLYHRMNRPEQATYYYAQAEQHRAKNPYFHYSSASYALDEGKLVKALSLIKQAIRQRAKEPRFYQLAAEIYERLGNAEQATAMREKMVHFEKLEN